MFAAYGATSLYSPNDRIPSNPKLILENMFCRVVKNVANFSKSPQYFYFLVAIKQVSMVKFDLTFTFEVKIPIIETKN